MDASSRAVIRYVVLRSLGIQSHIPVPDTTRGEDVVEEHQKTGDDNHWCNSKHKSMHVIPIGDSERELERVQRSTFNVQPWLLAPGHHWAPRKSASGWLETSWSIGRPPERAYPLADGLWRVIEWQRR